MATSQHKFKQTALALFAKFPHWHSQLQAARVPDIPSSEVLSMGLEVLQNYPDTNLLSLFASKTYQHWNKIRSRDVSFFLEDLGKVTSLIPQNLITAVFSAVDSKGELIIGSRPQKFIWDCLDCMVKFSIDYMVANPNQFSYISNLSALQIEWGR